MNKTTLDSKTAIATKNLESSKKNTLVISRNEKQKSWLMNIYLKFQSKLVSFIFIFKKYILVTFEYEVQSRTSVKSTCIFVSSDYELPI